VAEGRLAEADLELLTTCDEAADVVAAVRDGAERQGL